PFVELADTEIDMELARKIPQAVVRRELLLPFRDTEDEVYVAMADPLNVRAVDEVRGRLNRRIVPFLALQADLLDGINRAFNVGHEIQEVLDEITDGPNFDDYSVDVLLGLAEDAPIVRLVNSIVNGAITGGASDIHIEPQEDAVRVRYRFDGLLYDQMT